MVHDARATTSIWQATLDPRPEGALGAGPLTGDTQADVCVVGAGIAGLTTAYLLAREGRDVVVLERGTIGCGDTGRTTAHLANAIDDRYSSLERTHGHERARLACESHRAAIDRIEKIVADEGIDCAFARVDGYLFRAREDDRELLDREYEAARRAGAEVYQADGAPLSGYDTGPCLRFAHQAQFHPLAYLAGLASALRRMGVRIYGGTPAEEVAMERVATARGAVGAAAVVVATNVPVHLRFAVHPKQAPYRTYVIALRVPRGSVTRALYWDTADPYHYVRIHEPAAEHDAHDGSGTFDTLIVGGEDHKTGQADDGEERYARLQAWARVRFPMAGDTLTRWSGQVMETYDGLAFIGRGSDGVYLATGDSGMGMTHGTIAGLLLTDLIMGRANPWERVYDPRRVSLHGATDLARENLNVAMQYAGWITPGDVRSIGEIKPGSGAVVRRGLRKIAVYRDEQGLLHERSAVCTHLGCIVAWNHDEQAWDCPCHGSRFDAYGHVVSGPAIRDLAHVDDEARRGEEEHRSSVRDAEPHRSADGVEQSAEEAERRPSAADAEPRATARAGEPHHGQRPH
jgi:glycine/D-amino acid oxidase-like deaminating enzyme/nitrite reductase/ring-hydroxylating ferredoxin subunit